jgi:hypothetical protein
MCVCGGDGGGGSSQNLASSELTSLHGGRGIWLVLIRLILNEVHNHVKRTLRLVVRAQVPCATDHGVGEAADLTNVASYFSVVGSDAPDHFLRCVVPVSGDVQVSACVRVRVLCLRSCPWSRSCPYPYLCSLACTCASVCRRVSVHVWQTQRDRGMMCNVLV